MPIQLRDLGAILSPYQTPESLDLSGVADIISHNRDRTQGREIADQNLAQQQAALAEQKRQSEAEAAWKVQQESVRVAEAKAKGRQDLLAKSQATVDPLAQRVFEAQLPMYGLGVLPGGAHVSDPGQTELKNPERLEVHSAAPSGLEMPGLEMPVYSPIDMTSVQKGGLVDTATGQVVANYDPQQARERERQALDQQMKALSGLASNISAPAFSQAAGAAPGALVAAGYDSRKAADDLLKNVATPAAGQANANYRAQFQSQTSATRSGGAAARQWWSNGAQAAEKTYTAGGIGDLAGAYKNLKRSVTEMSSNPSPQATAQAMFSLARSANPLEKRMTDQDFKATQGGQSLLDMSETQLTQWFSGDQGAARRQAIAKALAIRSQQMLAEGKASYLKMAGQRDQLPNEDAKKGYHQAMARFADFGGDFYNALTEEDATRPQGMDVSEQPGESNSSFEQRIGGGVAPLPSDDDWETLPQ